MSWLKYFALPFVLKRAYKINDALTRSQNAFSKKSYEEALTKSQEAIHLGEDKLYKARMFEGLALSYLGHREASARAFDKAIKLFEKAPSLSEADKTYLRVYCYSFFKEGEWPKSLDRTATFPIFPRLSEVSSKILKTFPFKKT